MSVNSNYNNKVQSSPMDVKITADLINKLAKSYKDPIFNIKMNSEVQRNDKMYSNLTCSGDSIQLANSYVDRVNSDREGNRLFSNGQNRQWCADFTSYVINQTYNGLLVGFPRGTTSVSAIMSWGQQNHVYKTVPKTSKAEFIKNHVKPGDLVIEKNGKSHVGIVTKIYPDGSYDVTAGNTSDSVKTVRYQPDKASVSGFVLLSEYMDKHYSNEALS